MPTKLDFYAQMADHTAKQITGSFGEWTAFLETAGRLYKYPFHEQLMIFAQRPDATACAPYDLWNQKPWNLYVRRGSKGIALIDTSGDNPKLKYVFDVADTGGRENSRRPTMWEYKEEHENAVTAALEQRYGIAGTGGLADQLERISLQLVSEYWNDNSRDILDILANSFLEEYDDYNVQVAFRNAAVVSTTYTLMSRCGLNPGAFYEHEDFLSVFDFNTRETIAALGSVISNTSEQILRNIEITIKNYEREASLQKQAERTNDYGEHHELHTERGLSDSEPDFEREQEQTPREVRENEEELFEGTPSGTLEQSDSFGEAVSPSEGDRRDSEQENGTVDDRTDEAERSDGSSESNRSDEVDGTDEQSESTGRGNDSERADFQLSEESEPEPFISVRGEQLTLFDTISFPTETEQIECITQAESVRTTPFAFSFTQEEIDTVLKYGSNERDSRMRIAAEFMKDKSTEDHAAFLQNYFHGGNGFKVGRWEISAWYAEDGIHLAPGRSARYEQAAQVIPWTDAAARIGELLEQGQFASNVELIEAAGNERRLLAQQLCYMQSDIRADMRSDYFAEAMFTGSYDDARDRIADMLADPFMRDAITDELERFAADHADDRSILRFNYYKPDEMAKNFRELALMNREYTTEISEMPQAEQFITEDELNEAFANHGSGVEGSKARIYDYFTSDHNTKEKIAFLKNEYGIGGHSHALSGAVGSDESHDGKGIRFKKSDCYDVQISWQNAVKRIDDLIKKDRYLTPTEKLAHTALKTVGDAYNTVKHDHPNDIVLYQVGDFFEMYGEDAKIAAEKLDLYLTSRNLPDIGRVDMCGIPSHRLEQNAEKLRVDYPITICADTDSGRNIYSLDKLQTDTPAIEEPVSVQKTELTQADIDTALQAWNGDIESKRAVVRYMKEHGREKDTAKWLSREYGGKEDEPLHITLSGTDIDMEMSWAKVQRRIAQLIKEERFYTPEEYDRMDDVDPVVIRENLAARGIVNGELVNPEALENDPFVRMVEADAERIAQEENLHAETSPTVDLPRLPYNVGDTVYLDDTAFEITEIGEHDVQLRDPTLAYPIFRSENKALFEKMLEQDARNGGITEYLTAELDITDTDLQEVLTDEGGLLTQRDKEIISGWFRTGDTNTGVSQKLSEIYAGMSDSMTMPDGETADYRTTTIGLEIEIQDKYSLPFSFNWREVAPILRAMYEQERDGFFHEPVQREPVTLEGVPAYKVGDSVVVPYHDRDIKGTIGYIGDKSVRIDTGPYSWSNESINREIFDDLIRHDERNSHLFLPEIPEVNNASQLNITTETVGFYPAEENRMPYDVVIERLRVEEPEHTPPSQTRDEQDSPDDVSDEELNDHPVSVQIGGEWQTFPNTAAAEEAMYEESKAQIWANAQNFRITDDHLGEGGLKAKYQANINAIKLLKSLEEDGKQALPEQQEVLSRYVGWGGLADAFDAGKENWSKEYTELKELLTPEEYDAARASTLNAHYTSPTVIKAMYEAVGNMGFKTGNILEPSMGVGNFFGMLPDNMTESKLYGVELDSITGRIAKQLYPKADITVAGFETTDRRDFYDLAIGNVPFGQYKVNDRAYNKLGFSIHDYFFAKAIDQVRPGGVVAFITSRYTMDKESPDVRKYIAQRAELLGAIRLPNNAFKANAGTEVVSDILFFQKRDRPIEIEPDWVHLGFNEDNFGINQYFVDHPEMILGRQTSESTQYGKQDFTVAPIEGLELADQLSDAIKYIRGTYTEAELPDLGEGETIDTSIPADPNVKNFSYTVVDGDVYYRENSRMVKPDLNETAKDRVRGMVELRDCVQKLINQQMDGFVSDDTIQETQSELNTLYDDFTAKYGLINSRGNALAFSDDSSYYLLCSLEVLDEDQNLKRKADMFTKRTIKPHEVVTSVDTAAEALALSISEKACVDMGYMSELTGKTEEDLASELHGVIFRLPERPDTFVPADEYLSGNVREKLRTAENYAANDSKFSVNVEALRAAQPKDLDASEIEVRLGATWIDRDTIRDFMWETFETPYYLRRTMDVNYSQFTAEWNITGKSQPSYSDVNAYMTFGTERANAYKILEDTLNLRDVRIYDTVTDPDGRERRVLNSKETTLAQQKQQAIKDAFQDWIWRDPDRRQELVGRYNELFNSNRPREYDGSHITFSGMNPEIKLREHQLNAVAHILYGGNTLLAHEVGAGKTFEMIAAAMESKRLGLCQKPIFVVPNHLTEQWASEFLRLYPSANILAATKKDFEPKNRKKFCARIATGDYDAIIIGHSQFERIPVSQERQERLLQEQIAEIEEGLEELKASRAERFTIKSLERTKKSLETRLEKLQDSSRKDDVITFEQLGVDRLYVDEAHAFKNLFLYTKMRNVAGLSTTDAQKSSDMLLKCRYIDEVTDNKGIVFATGTPVSNSMTELYTMMRYLQHDTIRNKGLAHFDCWASTFGETTTAIELAPEGTGYRARTRFAKFFNLPELMNLFKEAADIKTADQLNLPTPTPIYHNIVAQPTEIQQAMVQELSERAAAVHTGTVDPSVDNMLRITSDGRKLGLDQRVINPNLPDDPMSKVNMCVDNIHRIWDEGQAEKLTQLVFCDLSTPKNAAPERKAAKAAAGNLDSPELHALEQLAEKDAGKEDSPFTVYEDIRDKLVQRGIPREQIAFIHEANTEVRKKELFAKVRSGQVRVLMGSTFKMGAGMNVQDRLVALHDLDAPWRPGDLEQRSGRIIRQGNMNKEVHIFRYVTEATFDAYLWQTLENKQKFISQIMTSKSPVRSCEDIDETALSYAEIKALCAGDERIKEKMDLDVDVARLKLMKANHQSQQYRLEDNLLRFYPEQIEQNKGFIAGFESDMKTLTEHPHPTDGFAGMTVRNDFLTDKENAGAALMDTFKDVKGLEPVPIGSYRGFQMSLTLEDFGRDYVLTLKGKMTHRVSLGKDPRGNLTRIDNVLNNIPERLKTVQTKLDSLYAQMETAKAELGKPFPQEEELRVKSARLTELNIALNIDERTPMEQMADEAPRTAIAKSSRPSVLQKLHSYKEESKPEPTKHPQKQKEVR